MDIARNRCAVNKHENAARTGVTFWSFKQVRIYLTHEQRAALLKLEDKTGVPVSESIRQAINPLLEADGGSKMRAALYARFSSGLQRAASIEDQFRN